VKVGRLCGSAWMIAMGSSAVFPVPKLQQILSRQTLRRKKSAPVC
jgi:hypothetical protein